MMKRKNKIIQVPMSYELAGELDALARRRGESRAAFIREACAEYIASSEKADADHRYEEGYRRIPEDRELLEALETASAESLKDDPW
jgi:metal-responsive CopG/Arc/MetJ family transcriptional regulator